MARPAAEILTDVPQEWGVDIVFGLPGDGINGIMGARAMGKKRAAKRRRWVRQVRTDSTAPPPGTFNRPAAEIARTMARKDVSPKGPGSGIRMIQYFINRAGKSLSPTRRAELERAKRLLQRRAAQRKVAGKKR